MAARPFPLRTKSSSAARLASVAALSLGSSRKQPVVLERNTPSYCFRFCAVMSAASYVIVVVHAPVLAPSASTVFAASGIDECMYPVARPSTRTLRGFAALAGALSGSAAIIASTSVWQGTCGVLLRPPHGAGAGCCAVTRPAPAGNNAAPTASAIAAADVIARMGPPGSQRLRCGAPLSGVPDLLVSRARLRSRRRHHLQVGPTLHPLRTAVGTAPAHCAWFARPWPHRTPRSSASDAPDRSSHPPGSPNCGWSGPSGCCTGSWTAVR